MCNFSNACQLVAKWYRPVVHLNKSYCGTVCTGGKCWFSTFFRSYSVRYCANYIPVPKHATGPLLRIGFFSLTTKLGAWTAVIFTGHYFYTEFWVRHCSSLKRCNTCSFQRVCMRSSTMLCSQCSRETSGFFVRLTKTCGLLAISICDLSLLSV